MVSPSFRFSIARHTCLKVSDHSQGVTFSSLSRII